MYAEEKSQGTMGFPKTLISDAKKHRLIDCKKATT